MGNDERLRLFHSGHSSGLTSPHELAIGSQSLNSQNQTQKRSIMKRTIRVELLTVVLTLGGVAGFAFASSAADDAPKVRWKVSGDLEEACSCRAACPCWFKSLPSRMTCDGAQIIFINKGRYGKTVLDGLALAEFVQSPEHQTMLDSFGNWNFDYVYIDEKANEDQRAALKELAAHFFAPGAKKREFRFVPITRKIEGTEHISTIGEYALCSGHLVEGGLGGAPKVVNPPLADPTHRQYLQGETTKLTYKDAGQNWTYEKSNYMRNKFDTDNKEYEKFEAAFAKKMKGM